MQAGCRKTLVFLAGSAQTGVARALLEWAQAAGAECLEVSAAVLAKLAAKDNPQTVLASFEQRWADEPGPAAVADSAVWLALEAVRDPGNLGTIVRTGDAVGAAGVILCRQLLSIPIRGRPCAPAWGRSSMCRSCGWRPTASAPGPGVARRHRRHAARRARGFPQAAYRAPTLLLMGSEGPGLSPELAALCTRLVKIPMAGRLDSLNLAVATALMLYEIRRSTPASR